MWTNGYRRRSVEISRQLPDEAGICSYARPVRALITGCAGFIGSHLSERLLGDGWDVLGIDCFNENYGRRAKLENLREAQQWDAFEFVPVDLSRGDLADLVADCDLALHLAAEPGTASWGDRFDA